MREGRDLISTMSEKKMFGVISPPRDLLPLIIIIIIITITILIIVIIMIMNILRLNFLYSLVLGEDRMAFNKEKPTHLVPPRVSAENVGSKVCVE